MANLFTEKFGSLIQYGVGYMIGFNSFADQFVEKWNECLPDISSKGYSADFDAWKEQNEIPISNLYDELKNANLIPTAPQTEI